MKTILLSCQNVSALGGSEMYHYELIREIINQTQHEIYVFQLNPTIHDPYFFSQIKSMCKDIFVGNIPNDFVPDTILTSQPGPTKYILNKYHNTVIPIVSVIHSEIRSEDPIISDRIKHYIGIRQSIVDMLINTYHIPKEKVSMIYNPIDKKRFNTTGKFDIYPFKDYGIFVGEVLDNIRIKPAIDFANFCIENKLHCTFISKSRFAQYDHNFISFLDPFFNTEYLLKHAKISAGIVHGRTLLESLSCGVKHYNYNIDIHGNIISKSIVINKQDIDLCDSIYVTKQILSLLF